LFACITYNDEDKRSGGKISNNGRSLIVEVDSMMMDFTVIVKKNESTVHATEICQNDMQRTQGKTFHTGAYILTQLRRKTASKKWLCITGKDAINHQQMFYK
jgi:hypothetical protein